MSQLETRHGLAQCTLDDYETRFADRHLLHGVLAKWAQESPEKTAIIDTRDGTEVTWRQFAQNVIVLAMKLVDLGFEKGDVFATSLPFLPEHIYLEYACFQIGLIHAPLDLRLKAPEVIRSLNLVGAKAFAFLGKTPVADFDELGRAVQANCPGVRHLIQFAPPEETIDDALSATELSAQAAALADEVRASKSESDVTCRYFKMTTWIEEQDPAQAIFTTGSTGYPKAALLSHRGITCQNMCIGAAFGMSPSTRFLVNLPPSHVGGQAEQLMSTFFWGGTAIVLPLFDPAQSLDAIETYNVDVIGQIPALFSLEWRQPDYPQRDLSSLRFAIYGGQQVSRPFLERLSTMAPRFGTGLGLTETSGFCTYTPPGATVEEIGGQTSAAGGSIGFDMPVYPISIRKPMTEDGTAGEELPIGEIGEICFKGPQTFLGYLNDEEATRRTLSSDNVVYTGDLGFLDKDGLHFAGRRKWVIKSKGYQIFPAQVEEFICQLREDVAACGIVGVEHEVFGEGIVAFVERMPASNLNLERLHDHVNGIAAYMRPLHFVILEPGALPLNRVAKTDYVTLASLAKTEVETLRLAGGWDAGGP